MRLLLIGLAVSLGVHAAAASTVAPRADEDVYVVARVVVLQPAWKAEVRTVVATTRWVEPAVEVVVVEVQEAAVAKVVAVAPDVVETGSKQKKQDVESMAPRKDVANVARAAPKAATPTRSLPKAKDGGRPKVAGAPKAVAAAGDEGEGPVVEPANGPPAAAREPAPVANAEMSRSPVGGPASGGGGGNGSDSSNGAGLEGQQAARSRRLALIAATSARVASGLRYPRAARRLSLEGEVLVRCALEAGRWRASVARSSGIEHFDLEALRATDAALAEADAADPQTTSFVVPVRFRLTAKDRVAGSDEP